MSFWHPENPELGTIKKQWSSMLDQLRPPRKAAVAGAGLAGLMAAYELTKQGYEVDIFEKLEGPGGRIRDGVTASGSPISMGGELIDTSHTAMLQFCRENGIELIDTQGGGREYYSDGKKCFKDTDLLDPERAGGGYYKLAQAIAEDQKKLHNANGGWSDHARALDKNMSIQDYLQKKAQETGTGQEVVDVMSAAYLHEIGHNARQLSSLNLIDMVGTDVTKDFAVYGPSDERFAIKGGTGRIVDTLMQKLEQSGKAKFHFGQALKKVDSAASGKILTFAAKDGSETSGQFDYVISTIPPKALAQVEGLEHLGIAPGQAEFLKTLQYNHVTKIIIETKSKKPWEGIKGIEESNGKFTGPFFAAWPADNDSHPEKGAMTFYVGGDKAMQPIGQLVRECKDEYAKLLGKTAGEVFADSPPTFMQHGKTGGCLPAPQQGAYIKLAELGAQLNSQPDVGFAGCYITQPSAEGTWIGFMDNAVASGQQAAQRAVETLRQKDIGTAHYMLDAVQRRSPAQPSEGLSL